MPLSAPNMGVFHGVEVEVRGTLVSHRLVRASDAFNWAWLPDQASLVM